MAPITGRPLLAPPGGRQPVLVLTGAMLHLEGPPQRHGPVPVLEGPFSGAGPEFGAWPQASSHDSAESSAESGSFSVGSSRMF